MCKEELGIDSMKDCVRVSEGANCLGILPDIQPKIGVEGESNLCKKECREVRKLTSKEWQEKAEALWALLDDVDTAGDMFKPEITAYFKYVNKKSQERFQHLTSDGYNIFPTSSKQEQKSDKEYTFGFSADDKGIVGLRRVEVYNIQGEWRHINFEDIHKDDILRMFEPDGKSVLLNKEPKMKAISEVYTHPTYGVPTVDVETIQAFNNGQCHFERNQNYLCMEDMDTGKGIVIDIEDLIEGIFKLFQAKVILPT
jgi:hypothetical protein